MYIYFWQTEHLEQRPKLEREKRLSGRNGWCREIKWGNRGGPRGGREPDPIGCVGFSKKWFLLWIKGGTLYIFEGRCVMILIMFLKRYPWSPKAFPKDRGN